MSEQMSVFAKTIMEQKYSHQLNEGTETWENIAYRVTKNVLNSIGITMASPIAKDIFELIKQRKFIPAGRYLYASGRPYHQVQNCLALRAEDSREGWSDLLQKSSLALMTGAGIGVEYSSIRSEGKLIRKTGGFATGPLALMQMINECGRGIMQGGNRRCLPSGSLIHTFEGLKPIESIQEGEKVLTTENYCKVIKKFNQGIQKTIIIKTQMGELECTPNHKVAVIDDVYGNYVWKKASDLTLEDRLYFLNKEIEGIKTNLPENDFKKSKLAYSLKRITIPELDEGIAWLLGYFHGDGYVHLKERKKGKRNGIVSLACSKTYPEIKNKAFEQLSRFGTNVTIKQGDGNLWKVGTTSVELAYYFLKFKQAKTEIIVPNFIKQAKTDIKAAYIAGLMDADGCCRNRPIVIAAQIYPNYLKEIQALLSSIGIPSRFKLYRKSIGNWKPLYHLSVCNQKPLIKLKFLLEKFGHKHNFPIPSNNQQYCYGLPSNIVNKNKIMKQRGITINTSIECIERRTGRELYYTPIKIISIEEGREVQTWDIEVENKHEFVTNGYLVHNSAIWAGLNWQHPDIHKFIRIKNWSNDIKELKAKDYNFPAPLDGTNISVRLDEEFFKAYHNDKHKLHAHALSVYWATVEQMCSTGEPGFSIDTKDSKNEILRNACNEFCSEDDSDICNLGSINIAKIANKEEMEKIVELATLFLLAGSVYSDVPYAKVDLVRTKNRRLGLGLMGIHEWLLLKNKNYGPDNELEEYLQIYQKSTEYAKKWAEEYDLSAPIKTRAIAPSGTIGIIAETTTGIEPIFCVSYKRRYLKHKTWHYQYVIDPTAKKLIEEKGISSDKIEDAYILAENVEKRVLFQSWIQKYVDMGISSTINLPNWGSELNNKNTLLTFGNMLIKYLPDLRGITVYPDGSRDGQPLTPIKYTTAVKNIGEELVEDYIDVCDLTKGGSCSS